MEIFLWAISLHNNFREIYTVALMFESDRSSGYRDLTIETDIMSPLYILKLFRYLPLRSYIIWDRIIWVQQLLAVTLHTRYSRELNRPEAKLMPSLQRYKDVSIMWLESREWIKFGANPFLCFIELTRYLNPDTIFCLKCRGVYSAQDSFFPPAAIFSPILVFFQQGSGKTW